MSMIHRRRWVAGLILGMGRAATAAAQDLPPALPMPGPAPAAVPAPVAPAFEAPPLLRPRPPVVLVPPEGYGPTWTPGPIDPVAVQRRPPGNVEKKVASCRWRRLQGKLWGYPEEFEPRPLGAALYDNARTMTANAASARLVLHHFDFLPGSPELNPRGLDQLSQFVAQLAVSPFPLIVERTPENPALAEARRVAVLTRLAGGPIPVGPDRVFVGVPAARGLSGPDAQVIAGNALGRVQQYGPPIPINSNGVNSPSGVTSVSGAGSNGGINP
jgi:hypothetical protein